MISTDMERRAVPL